MNANWIRGDIVFWSILRAGILSIPFFASGRKHCLQSVFMSFTSKFISVVFFGHNWKSFWFLTLLQIREIVNLHPINSFTSSQLSSNRLFPVTSMWVYISANILNSRSTHRVFRRCHTREVVLLLVRFDDGACWLLRLEEYWVAEQEKKEML